MLTLKLSALTLIALGLLFNTSLAGDNRLNAQSVKGLFPGQYEARFKGYKVMVVALPGGQLMGHAFGRDERGQWFVRGNRVCVAWTRWTDGEPKCGTISRQGKWLVARNNDGQMFKFRKASVVATESMRSTAGEFALVRRGPSF